MSTSDPAEALRQIAFNLEELGESTYKVKAFRNAAAVVEGLDRSTLEAAAQAGTLTDIAGIGKATATAIAQALKGEKPDYLNELEERRNAPPPPEVVAVLQALRGDCHLHSNWSDGGSPIDEMVEAGIALGHDYMVLTDHSPRLTIAHGLNPARLREQLEVIAEINQRVRPFRLLTGIEVDILEDGSLDQEEALLAQLDVVVASVHSKLRMPSEQMTARMLKAIASPHTDILGHCTGRLLVGQGRPESTFDAEVIFEACALTETALEINCRPERRDPPTRLIRQAMAAGCLFSVDTDAHAPGQLSWQVNGAERVVELEIELERIVNSWDADALLAWTDSHAELSLS